MNDWHRPPLLLRMIAVSQKFLVFIVFAIGIAGLFVYQRPFDKCDTIVNGSKVNLAGIVFPKVLSGGGEIPPTLFKAIRECKLSNSQGGCFDYFNQMRVILREFESAVGCEPRMAEVPEYRKILEETMTLFSQIAWGDGPPAEGERGLSWLQISEVSLFCRTKRSYLLGVGEANLVEAMKKIFSTLPGEKPIFEDKKCINCENLKSAASVLGEEAVWVRSLFSLRCENYF